MGQGFKGRGFSTPAHGFGTPIENVVHSHGSNLRELTVQPSFRRITNLPIMSKFDCNFGYQFRKLPPCVILRYPVRSLDEVNQCLAHEDFIPAEFIIEDMLANLVGFDLEDTMDNISTEVADFVIDRYSDENTQDDLTQLLKMPINDTLYNFYGDLLEEIYRHIQPEELHRYKFDQMIDGESFSMRLK